MNGAPLSSVPEVDHARDVLAGQAARELGLAQEPLDDLAAVDQPGLQQLDRDRVLELDMRRLHHDAHAAAADHAVDPVATREHGAGLDAGARCHPRRRGARAVTRAEHTARRRAEDHDRIRQGGGSAPRAQPQNGGTRSRWWTHVG